MNASAPLHDLYWINAFTTGTWHSGNTAAVVRTRQPLSEEKMQLLAIQHQVAETAFVYPLDERQHEYALRWFSPVTEVDLCGHATLAAAHVLLPADQEAHSILFRTRKAGQLVAWREQGRIGLTLPAQPQSPLTVIPSLARQMAGPGLVDALLGEDLLLVFDDPDRVLNFQPDSAQILRLPGRGLVITAPGLAEFDFISRFFAPRLGIAEDAATGSAHCALGPYWSARLNRQRLRGWQASSRGGDIEVETLGHQVRLWGQCQTYSHGPILV